MMSKDDGQVPWYEFTGRLLWRYFEFLSTRHIYFSFDDFSGLICING